MSDIFDILRNEGEDTFKDKAFKMNRSYVPKPEKDLVLINGKRILTNGNFAVFVSPPGAGKSNACEAIVAKGVNPECDAFGFEVNLTPGRKMCLIDTERTLNNFNTAQNRINRRAKIYERMDEEIIGHDYTKFDLFSYRRLNVDEYITHLKWHAENGDYELIICDQIGDFLDNVNDPRETKKLIKAIEDILDTTDCGIIFTIHPNAKDITYKPTGWIGSYLMKKCESMFACFKTDSNTSMLTNDLKHFENAKNRNGKLGLSLAFTWNDDAGMMIGINVDDSVKEKVSKEWLTCDTYIEEAFEVAPQWSPLALSTRLKEILKGKKIAEKINEDWVYKYSTTRGKIQLLDGFYYLVDSDRSDEIDNNAPF